MKTVNIHAAKTHLSSLLEEVAAGEEIIIAKAGKPVARLAPLEKPKFERKPGFWKGMIEIYDNFDDPLPPDIAKAFGMIDEPVARHARAPVVRRSSPRLGRKARSLIRSTENIVWVSAASLWEISIKASLGRARSSESFVEIAAGALEQHHFRPLPIHLQHALAVRLLPMHHRDPFDRMLVAQAQCEDLTLVTADPLIAPYDIRTIDASR